jgi:hypothetical protein
LTRRPELVRCSLTILGCLSLGGCQLQRPQTVPSRIIEPHLAERTATPKPATPAIELRLLETHARAHIARRLLHQRPDGELIEDPVWKWSSAPDRYLDTALRLEFATNGAIQLVDSAAAPMVAVTLLAWHIEERGTMQLLAAIELRFTGTDRIVRTQLIRDGEPVSGGLPGDLSVAAGRLLSRLASEVAQRVAGERPQATAQS